MMCTILHGFYFHSYHLPGKGKTGLSSCGDKMSLLLKNPRIYDFYQNNPQYDFEKMNHFLVDLLEKFQEKINPAFDQSFATRLLEQMGEIQKQLMKQQTDQQLEYYKQLGEIRKQHLEEMQILVANHHNEKV